MKAYTRLSPKLSPKPKAEPEAMTMTIAMTMMTMTTTTATMMIKLTTTTVMVSRSLSFACGGYGLGWFGANPVFRVESGVGGTLSVGTDVPWSE